MTTHFRSTVTPIVAALLLGVSAGCHASDREFNRDVAADPSGTVEISNVSGKLRVIGWDKPTVSVHATLESGVDRVDVITSKGRTVVKVVRPSMSFRGNGDADIEVHVPRQSEVEATATSADLASSQILGSQRLRTVSGNLRADIAADFEGKTVSGDMRLRGSAQKVDMRLSSVSGDITLDHGTGDIDATSISGEIRVEVDQAHEVRLHSTSGDLTFRGSLVDGATIEADTVSGDVTLRPRAPAGFEYEATSFSGDINNCLGGNAEATSRHGPGTRLNGRTGDGKGRLRVKSLSGDLEICDH